MSRSEKHDSGFLVVGGYTIRWELADIRDVHRFDVCAATALDDQVRQIAIAGLKLIDLRPESLDFSAACHAVPYEPANGFDEWDFHFVMLSGSFPGVDARIKLNT